MPAIEHADRVNANTAAVYFIVILRVLKRSTT
jgi:hypothetical protein